MYSLHPLVNPVAIRMSVPVCLPEQYSSSEDGPSGPENLNVKSSMLPLIFFSTAPSVLKQETVQVRNGQLLLVTEFSSSHQSVLNSVLFVPSRRLSTPLLSPILFMTLILKKSDYAAYFYFIVFVAQNFHKISRPMLRTAIALARLICLAYHVTCSVCCDDAAPS